MDYATPAPAAVARAAPPRPLPRLLAPAEAPRLSVVVVNYLRWQDTASLLRQLCASPALRRGDAEVVVVDNHSPWHPLVPRLRRHAAVSLRRWRHNRGFARAGNEGCRLSRGDWLLLLNPDVSLAPDFLDRALAHALRLGRQDPSAGIIGFGLRDPDGTPQASAGPFPTLSSTLARLLVPRARRKYYLGGETVPRRVDWVTGCCLLVRRSCWEDLGGFDPAFFLYYEDVDLCRRARDRGWEVWHDPSLTAVHHHPLHRRVVPPHLRLITRHALLTYAGKHWPAWQRRLLGGVVRLEAWARRRQALTAGEHGAAEVFRILGQTARDLGNGRTEAAGRRLRRVVRHREEEVLAAAAVRRHPQP
jgi:GT2 family glycosyltransferase